MSDHEGPRAPPGEGWSDDDQSSRRSRSGSEAESSTGTSGQEPFQPGDYVYLGPEACRVHQSRRSQGHGISVICPRPASECNIRHHPEKRQQNERREPGYYPKVGGTLVLNGNEYHYGASDSVGLTPSEFESLGRENLSDQGEDEGANSEVEVQGAEAGPTGGNLAGVSFASRPSPPHCTR